MSLPPLLLPLIPPVPLKCACRHPKPEDSIKPSPLHPLVPVAERFIHWLMPYGLDYMDHLSKYFPPSIVAHNCIVLCHCIMQNSLNNYVAGLLCFTWFCDNFLIPKTTRMPATKALLCIFITSHGTGHVGQGTLTSWVTGLELWHSINSAPWLGKGHLNHAIKAACYVP